MNIKFFFITMIIIFITTLFIVIKKISPNSIIKKTKDSKKQLELTYEINAGIPFRWEFEIDDENIVEFVKSYVVRDDNVKGITGASIYTNYVFKGLKEGKTTITFKYIHFTEGEVVKEKKHTVKVDNKNNISLCIDNNKN